MATQFDPIAKDESLNTTESPSRNIADVLAEELSAIEQAIAGGSGSGGHVIENASGTDMTQRAKMQFVDAGVTDDSANDRTKVEIVQTISAEADLTSAPDGVYQGTWDEDPSDVLTADMVGMGDGTGDTVKDRLDRGSVSVTADGVKTISAILDGIFSQIDFSKVTRNTVLQVSASTVMQVFTLSVVHPNSDMYLYRLARSGSQCVETIVTLLSSGSTQGIWTGGTYMDESSGVPTSGRVFTLYY